MRKKSKTKDKDKDSLFFSLSADYEGICNSYEASTEREKESRRTRNTLKKK